MSRFSDLRDELYAAMRAIVPESLSDDRFDGREDGYGGVRAPSDWLMDYRRTLRQFDIRSSGTETGPGCNVLTHCEIRIVYGLETDLGLLDQMIQEDYRSILNEVIADPSKWTNASSVFIEDGAVPEAEIVNDPDDKPHNVVVSIPIVLDYRRMENEIVTPFDASQVWNHELGSSTWYNHTAQWPPGSGGGWTLHKIAVQAYVGYEARFDGLRFEVNNLWPHVACDFLYSYWNGTEWYELPQVTDATDCLTLDGDMRWRRPTDWVPTTVNGEGPYYYVRIIRIEGTSSNTRLIDNGRVLVSSYGT